MIFSDSDDERGDKEDHYEHDDEGSLYADTRRVLEMPRRLHPNVPTTTTQATRQRRPLLLLLKSLGKKDQKPLDLNRLGDSRRVRYDAGRSSFFFSARCVIIGPTLLRWVVVNYAR
jgi:hypothetical protein